MDFFISVVVPVQNLWKSAEFIVTEICDMENEVS